MMNYRSISLALLVAASVSVVGLSAGFDVAQARSELSVSKTTAKSSKTEKVSKSKTEKSKAKDTKASKSKDTKTTKATKTPKTPKNTKTVKGANAHPDNQYIPGKQYGYKHGVGAMGRYNENWRPGQIYK